MLSGQRAGPGRGVDANSANMSPNAKLKRAADCTQHINRLIDASNVFSINLIMTDSSAFECLGISVITGLRSLSRVQSIAEQSNYTSS